MKRFAGLAVLLIFLLSACGPMYSIKRDKKGIYSTAELEYNMLATDKGDFGDYVLFNLCKYMYGGNTFYSAKISYNYPEKGWDFLGMGPGVAGFDIRMQDGVMIRVNNGKTVPLKYKRRPEHQVITTYSNNGYGAVSSSRQHQEWVECVLTPAQLSYLVNARSIVITIYGTIHEREDQTKEKKIEYYFKDENFKIIKRFFDEEIKNLKTGSGT